MSKELEPVRPSSSSDLELAAQLYDPARVAGIWARRPLAMPQQIFPFLVLSRSRLDVPLNQIPYARFDAGTTSTESYFRLPKIESEDDFMEFAELGLVQIIGRLRRRHQVQVWIPRNVHQQRIHPGISETLGTYLNKLTVDWDPASLQETDVNDKFATLKSRVPASEVTLDLGGPPQTVPASAIIAAGLRLAVCETMGIQQVRDLRDSRPDLFQPIKPE